MTKCNCCNKEYKSDIAMVEACQVIGVQQVPESLKARGVDDMLLINCDCGSTAAIRVGYLINEMFKCSLSK